jgi:hypothetical protein
LKGAPNTPVEEGIERFIQWYKSYFKIKWIKTTFVFSKVII